MCKFRTRIYKRTHTRAHIYIYIYIYILYKYYYFANVTTITLYPFCFVLWTEICSCYDEKECHPYCRLLKHNGDKIIISHSYHDGTLISLYDEIAMQKIYIFIHHVLIIFLILSISYLLGIVPHLNSGQSIVLYCIFTTNMDWFISLLERPKRQRQVKILREKKRGSRKKSLMPT